MVSFCFLLASSVMALPSSECGSGQAFQSRSSPDSTVLNGAWIVPPDRTQANYLIQEQYGYACKLDFVEQHRLHLSAPGQSETGTYRVDLRVLPATIDFTDAQGKDLRGILKFQHGKLCICWGFSGTERPTTFQNGPRSVVMVLQRESK